MIASEIVTSGGILSRVYYGLLGFGGAPGEEELHRFISTFDFPTAQGQWSDD